MYIFYDCWPISILLSYMEHTENKYEKYVHFSS